ncbi:TetR/AcrR family transcriptional regulator [Streptomyces sp. NPDC002793]|uniref:TetR/AcrR family transcriptional regulator n=1 Tax=Streptomyces sp. NPDC002793 TaxID=3154432 RepID=UPI00331EE34F
MPSAREALLDSARSALSELPWTAVRMVDVAADAGVSRQTLYNEFGSKDGLARALVRRAADGYLAGVEGSLGAAAEGEWPAELVRWTVRAARADVLVRALLTGVWGERLPGPGSSPGGSGSDSAPPTPLEFLVIVRDRAVAALGAGRPPRDPGRLELTCEVALRLALSYMLVPTGIPPAPGAQCAEPDSCSPITPMITSEIDTSLRAETTSSRKIIP